MKCVYLAGPIGKGPGVHRNVLNAIDVANEIMALGAEPFVPHYSFYHHIVHPRPYEAWMRADFEWIGRCDALFRMPGESPGSDREVVRAQALGLPVFHSLHDLGVWLASVEGPC